MMAMAAVHALDALWFLVSMIVRKLVHADPPKSEIKRAVKIYLALDVVTMIWFFVCVHAWSTDAVVVGCVGSTTVAVFSLGAALVVDLWLCGSEWYFSKDD